MREARSTWWIPVVLALAGCGTDGAGDAIADGASDAAAEVAPEVVDEVTPEAVEPPGRLRFVHVSDLHYGGSLEAPEPAYLANRVARVNALAEGVDLVVSTGDHVDDLEARFDVPGTRSPLHVVAEALDTLAAPWIATLGNHEHYLSFEPLLEMCPDPQARKAAFTEAFGFEPFSVHVVHGVRLILLDTNDGPTWNQNAGVLGSLTPERLAWLDETLAADPRPTVVFAHHPLTTIQDPDEGVSLCDVLEAHADRILGYFAGHLHSFLKGTACGVPYYLVGNWRDADDAFFVVDVDGAAGSLTLVNEADLPFATPPDFSCEPGRGPLLGDPGAAVGTVQRLVVTETSTDAAGLGQYVGDALQSIPFLLTVDSASAAGLSGRLTVASRWSDPEDFYAYVAGAPCAPFDWRLDDPCASFGPATLAVNALIFLEALADVAPDPSWRVRVTIEDLLLEGRLAANAEGVPVVAEGVIQARMETGPAIDDVKQLVVAEYCAGRIDGCAPGSSEGFPACPAGADAAFFAEVPKACDVTISGFSVRSILGMLATLPETIHALGRVTTEVVPVGEPAPGNADPGLFATEAGKNCAGSAGLPR